MVRALLRRARQNPFLDHLVGRIFQYWYRLPFPPTHYYSPLPDLLAVKRNMPRWYRESSAPGIDWNLRGQIELSRALTAYVKELGPLPSYAEVAGQGFGPGYGVVEAQILYTMLRHLRPTRVIEIGSGVSTYFTLAALRANWEHDKLRGSLTCIEPYPSPRLLELVAETPTQLHSCEVQNVSLETFDALSSNDVLFIDSSHVSKKDSDVDYLYLEVLPRLHKGVVIHIHDIALPMPALPTNHALFDTYLFWNEASLVKAFLLFNHTFEILMCQSYLHWKNPDVLASIAPAYDAAVEFPASLWLRRVS